MNEPQTDSRAFRYREIAVGNRHERDYVITPETYGHFLAAFNDHSPVHVDEAFAKSRGFTGRVMHGALLNGFVSHFIGMWFPGRFSLLLAADLRYSNPACLGDTINLAVVVSQKMDTSNLVVLDATLTNTTRNSLAARGRLQVMIKDDA
jgi:3-oxoacyl-[acyl-carrier protein] reductase